MAGSIVSTLVTAFTTTAEGIGSAIVSLFKDIFLANGEISAIGTYLLVIAGVGFAFGLSKVVFGLIRNRG